MVSVSVIIPAFNVSDSIATALDSVFAIRSEQKERLEVIVIDDGSDDGEHLQQVVSSYGSAVRLVSLPQNQGKARAVNQGISLSTAAYLLQLDADDCLVANWYAVIEQVVADPLTTNSAMLFFQCCSDTGEITSENTLYRGEVTFQDRLAGKYAGEYIVLFRGDFVRQHGYADLGITHAGYEEYSYLRFLQFSTGYVVPSSLRVYNRPNSDGLSGRWWKARQAADRVKHLEYLLRDFGKDFARHAPRALKQKYLRLAVYRHFAGQAGVRRDLLRGVSTQTVVESIGAVLLILLPRRFAAFFVVVGKQLRLVKRWG